MIPWNIIARVLTPIATTIVGRIISNPDSINKLANSGVMRQIARGAARLRVKAENAIENQPELQKYVDKNSKGVKLNPEISKKCSQEDESYDWRFSPDFSDLILHSFSDLSHFFDEPKIKMGDPNIVNKMSNSTLMRQVARIAVRMKIKYEEVAEEKKSPLNKEEEEGTYQSSRTEESGQQKRTSSVRSSRERHTREKDRAYYKESVEKLKRRKR
ncbi:hypothetical protein ACHWQZ_G002127 [Mnemiopsis leidyi]